MEPTCCDTVPTRCDTTPKHCDTGNNASDMAGLRVGASGSAREWPSHRVVSQYNFCIVTGGLRHGAKARACAWRHDATQHCARGLGIVRAKRARSLVLRCAHYALDSVLTQCTVYSHCLNHCSRTLFTGFSKKKKISFVYDLIYGIFILNYL